ncbi:hypothetical protein Syn7502_01996 [Synechococcus sp. PCC 7502]|uniref:hypothetical protein n=1 Tax=Synechococcus sp. PCC 7502 TaxID=1173263 RepID=UPI00029F9239|nr:hypothetical protein [Synechococcus sp. PCC 7502]AFY74023.1 hypothetical protein Syn7502_01996 [Synechococcus sp. PCC 7502]
MSDIAIFQELIKEIALVPLTDNKVVLKEPELSDCFVTIHGMPDEDEVIIIKADTFKSPDSVFKGEHGECKRADFIIVADTNTKKVIICVELKKTKNDEKSIIKQLIGAKCFVLYCQEIGKSFWRQPNFLRDYQYRFVSINHIEPVSYLMSSNSF